MQLNFELENMEIVLQYRSIILLVYQIVQMNNASHVGFSKKKKNFVQMKLDLDQKKEISNISTFDFCLGCPHYR